MAALLNPVVWGLAVALCITLLATRATFVNNLTAALDTASAPSALWLLAAVVAGHVAIRLALGLSAPGDFAGELIAARARQLTGSFYSDDLRADRAAIAARSGRPLAAFAARLMPESLTARIAERNDTGIVGQGHPPTVFALLVPIIDWLGGEGAFLCVAMLSVVATVAVARAAVAAVAPTAPLKLTLLAAIALAGWQPTLAAIRDGQLSVVIGALAVLSWTELRRGRYDRSGVAVGIATALKFYPAILIFALGGRSRRAAAVALLTATACIGATVLLTGPDEWVAYQRAIHDVVAGHVRATANLSLLARLAEWLPLQRAVLVWVASGTALLALTLWRARAESDDPVLMFDRAFGRLACLALVLSPIAWGHYLLVALQPLLVLMQAATRHRHRGMLAVAVSFALLLSLPVAETSGVWAFFRRHAPWASVLSPTTLLLLLWAALMWPPLQGRNGLASS